MSRNMKQLIIIYSLDVIAIMFTIIYISSTINAMTTVTPPTTGDTLQVSSTPLNNTNINPQANQVGGVGSNYELQPAIGYRWVQ